MVFSPRTARTVAHHGKYNQRLGITPQYLLLHHWAGTSGGLERLTNPTADVSANYAQMGDGSLVGQVPEEYRAWTSGSFDADARGITVETQNSGGQVNGNDNDPNSWPVSNAALEGLAQLLADLSARYRWGKLAARHLRVHREFFATACPGGYLMSKRSWIINRANQIRAGKGAAVGLSSTEKRQLRDTYLALLTPITRTINGRNRKISVRQDNADTNTYVRRVLGAVSRPVYRWIGGRKVEIPQLQDQADATTLARESIVLQEVIRHQLDALSRKAGIDVDEVHNAGHKAGVARLKHLLPNRVGTTANEGRK